MNAVRSSGNKSEGIRPTPPGYQPNAVDLTLMGWRDIDRRKSLEDVWRARSRFEAALRDDPRSVIALNGLASSYSVERDDPAHRMTAGQIAEHERVVELARAMAPNDATALLTWGRMQIIRGRADLALPALEKANRLVPSYPAGHLFIAQALLMLGRTDEVQARVERAVELAANEPRRTSNAYSLGAEAALMRGDDEAARDLARRGIAALPSNAFAHATLAAADALGGRSDEAATALAAFLKLWPDATVAHYDDSRRSTHPIYLAQRERLYEGLRKAGLPQQ